MKKLVVLTVLVAVLAFGGVVLVAHAQVYIFCSDGGYFTAYGPSQYWNVVSNQGFCGVYNGFSPASLRWVYNITNYPARNYAKWDWHNTGYDLPYNGHYFAFIDSSVSNRTTNARYTLTYNTASTYVVNKNQSLVSENWMQLTSGGGLYKPRNAWLDDPTGECSSCKRIVFDEIKIEY